MSKRGWWAVAHALSLVAILAVVVYCARGQWFFGDDWDFVAFRGVFGTHRSGLLVPHNEHWSTIPILMWRGLFTLFGIRSYWPYMGVMFAAHLTCVHLLWRILRRIKAVPEVVAVGAAAVLGLYGAGWENLLWAFQIGFVGSLACGLGLVAAIDEKGSTRRVAAVAVGAVLSLMFSGISVVMVVAAGLVALARWGWRKAAVVTVPAGVIYLVWLREFGQRGLNASDQLHGGLKDIPRFVVGGVGGTLGIPLGNRRLGSILFAVLIVTAVIFGRKWWKTAPEALALFVGAIGMFAVISQGRGALPEPATSRYLYIAAGLVIPLVTVSIVTLSRRVPAMPLIVAAGTVVLCVTGADTLYRQIPVQRDRDLVDKGQFFAALNLADTGVAIVSDQPQSPYNPDLNLADVRAIRDQGKLGPSPVLNARDRRGAELALLVGTPSAPPADRALGHTVWAPNSELTLTDRSDDCATVNAHGVNIVFDLAPQAAFSLVPSQSAQLQIYAVFEGGQSGPRWANAVARQTIYIVSDMTGRMGITLPPGDNRLCGINWGSV